MNNIKAPHETYEDKILTSANTAFELLANNETAKTEAAASRARLYAWLMSIDEKSRNVDTLVTPGMVDILYDTLYEKDTVEDLKVKNKALIHEGLQKVFKAAFTNAVVLTRQNDAMPWQHTGFHSDGKLKAVFAKAGDAPFQPIGFDDGEAYLPLESSKTLWRRQFALAPLFPYAPPFLPSEVKGKDNSDFDAVALSDHERAALELAHTEISEELESVMKANHPKEGEKVLDKAEAEYRLRETIKLATVRSPKLDAKLNKVKEDRPELGKNFENADIAHLASAILSWLALRLDEDKVRRNIQDTDLLVSKPEEAQKDLLKAMAAHLETDLKGTDEDQILNTITSICMARPSLRPFIDGIAEGASITTAAKELHAKLTQLLST
jgi:hypothetical protein